jgi:EAL domain-containing protein (putative c-di-GMP-specific phosphodiesterase class I)
MLLLQDLGCPLAQGFLFSAAVDNAAAQALVEGKAAMGRSLP